MRFTVRANGLERLIVGAHVLSERKIDRAVRSAITFAAKDYAVQKTTTVGQDIDRPMAFTKKAYNWDGADRRPGTPIESRAYVKPKQAKYLDIIEFGGTRQFGKKGAIAVVRDKTDRFGGLGGRNAIKRRFLNGRGKRIRYFQTDKGIIQVTRKKGVPAAKRDKLRRIVSYNRGKTARYNEQLDFRKDALIFGNREAAEKVARAVERAIRSELGRR